MGDEGAVDCDQPQSFDLTLREPHPIDGIACHWLRFDESQRVAFFDRDDLYAQAIEEFRQGGKLERQLELAKPASDGDLPKARYLR